MSGSSDGGYVGTGEEGSRASDLDATSFLVSQIINRIATTALVRVTAVSAAGEVSPVGLLDCQPMVHQIDGHGVGVPHGIINNVPYFRLQGGANAVILDPQVGDIGIAVFASRDSSSVKSGKVPGVPNSRRRYDWADALYIGGVLNGMPVQFVRFSADGIEIKAPTITLTGNVVSTGTFQNNGVNIGSTHRHSGVTVGAGTTGVPL